MTRTASPGDLVPVTGATGTHAGAAAQALLAAGRRVRAPTRNPHADQALESHPARRLIAAAVMFTGALIGALLVSNVVLVLTLTVAATVAPLTAVVAHEFSSESHVCPAPPGSETPAC